MSPDCLNNKDVTDPTIDNIRLAITIIAWVSVVLCASVYKFRWLTRFILPLYITLTTLIYCLPMPLQAINSYIIAIIQIAAFILFFQGDWYEPLVYTV